MPKTKISEFSATPGNNTDIDGINIAEGCAPSGINDAIRELMAQLKDFQAGTAGDSFNGPIGSTTPAAGTFTNLSASGTFALTGDQVQISEGGTGQTTANAAFNALAPSQTSNAGKYLKTDGTNTSWDALDISTADITGTLPIANGGTGLTALGTGVQTALGQNVTGSGGIVLASSPSLTTPNLGTPSAVTLTNATGLPLSTGVTGTLATTNGGTGLTSFSANQVFYASSTSAVAQSSNLQFSGTDLTVYGITVGRGAGALASNTAVGASALAGSNSGSAENTAIGSNALFTNTTGAYNTAVGSASMYSTTTAQSNAAVGKNTLYYNTTGSYNTAIGQSALQANTTASGNTAVGYQAAYANTTGASNVALGLSALGTNTTGSVNTAIGHEALLGNNADGGTAVGRAALRSNSTGTDNTGIGRNALFTNTTGANNVALGKDSLFSNTTASNNTAVGYQAAYTQTTAAQNTVVGFQAGYTNLSGTANVKFGQQAGYTNSTGSNNTFIGHLAGYLTTSGSNTFVGKNAGYSTTGANNTFVGCFNSSGGGCGVNVTTGSKNTILGGYDGNQGGLDIRTASNYIVLSDGDGNPLISTNSTRSVALNGAVPQTGTGITFPATQVASSDANTLDDYEEGTWTPTDNSGAALTFTINSSKYTKIGRAVTINLEMTWPYTANGNIVTVSLPFAADANVRAGLSAFSNVAGEVNFYIDGSANFVLYNDTGTQITNATMSTKYLIVSITYFT